MEMDEADIRNFMNTEQTQRIMSEVFVDLIAKSQKFRELKDLLKSIIYTSKEIELFYTKAEFPARCSACAGPIAETMYHCTACGCVYFCADCFAKGQASLPQQFYFKHSFRDHAKYIVIHKRLPQNSVLKKIKSFRPGAMLVPTFMQNAARANKCPRCNDMRAIRVDGCNRLFCTKCGFIFCHKCDRSCRDWDRRAIQAVKKSKGSQEDESHLTALQHYITHEERLGIDAHVTQTTYETMMQLLFGYTNSINPPRERISLYPSMNDILDEECPHPLFQTKEIFKIPTRCSYCGNTMDACQNDVIRGACGHVFCLPCTTKTAKKDIVIGRLTLFPTTDYGLGCPVKHCQNGLMSDPQLIRNIVGQPFFDLFLANVLLLSQNKPLQFSKCSKCNKRRVMDSEGRVLCHVCPETGSGQLDPTRRNITQEGWLTKKSSGVVTAWQRRYFILDENGILWTASEGNKTGSGSGLSSPSIAPSSTPPSSAACRRNNNRRKIMNVPRDLLVLKDGQDIMRSQQFHFSLESRQYPEPYCVYSDSLPDKNLWMNALLSWLPPERAVKVSDKQANPQTTSSLN
jgi:hypothetical protein